MESSPKTAFTSRKVGDVVVFDVEGEFSRTASPVPTLHDLVKAQLDKGARKVLFNFEKTGFVDSFGVGQIIGTYTSTQNLGGRFKLAAISPRLLALLIITRLVPDILQVHPNEEAAMESFAEPPAPGA